MVTGSKELIRDMNTQLVLRMIMNEGPISRASIALKLGLTKATISAIVQILLDKQLVMEIGSDDTKKGRKPILLALNKNCGYVISLDLSTDYITVLTANLAGENCALKRLDNTSDHQTIVDCLIQVIATAINDVPHCTYGVVGIALSIHGVIHQNKIAFIPYSPYQNIDFAQELEEHFHISVCLENEANLFALGEWAYTFKTKNMLAISVHSGIGLGIIMKDQLITGQNGYAGEFGHTIIERNGRPCPCGNGGCLEQYASERSLLKALSEKKGERITAEQFAKLYLRQDADARDIMHLFIEYMALGINNLLQTFNPDIIVINSSFTMYFPEICEAISQALHNDMKRYCHLVPSPLQDTAILLGGVYLCCQNFLELGNVNE